MQNVEAKYYVYEWVRPDYNEAYYVGKGSGDRAYENSRNDHADDVTTYLDSCGTPRQVRIIARFVNEKSSLDFEKERIAFLRPLGFLTNQTDGGDGQSSEWAKEFFNRPDIRQKSAEGIRAYSKTEAAKEQYKSNVVKREESGWDTRGEANRHAKLSKDQVVEILLSTDTNKDLAVKFSMHVDTISAIRNGSLWAHVKVERPIEEWKSESNKKRGSKGPKNGSAKLTEAQALEIIASDEKSSILAEKFGITRDHVTDIRKGRIWKHLHKKELE